MLALQSLNTAQFVSAYRAFSALSQCRRLTIHSVDVSNFLIKLLIGSWSQPVADQMGFEIPFFLKAWPRGEEKYALQYRVA